MMLPFESHSRRPEIQFDVLRSGPPDGIYIAPGDQITIQIWNAAANAHIAATARILRPDGELVPIQNESYPTNDRAVNELRMEVCEGWLTGLLVHPAAYTIPQGACYVVVWLSRGILGRGPAYSALFSGYLGTQRTLSFPGAPQEAMRSGPGNLRLIAGTNPAAAAEITEAVPTGAAWKLHALSAQLVTDATVANRNVRLMADDGANIYVMSDANYAHPGSTTLAYSAKALPTQAVGASTFVNIPWPHDLVLPAGHRIRTLTQNIQAGDNWGVPLLYVEEWVTQ